MTVLGPELLAITADLKLWARTTISDTKVDDVSWNAIGNVPANTRSLAAAQGKLMVVAEDKLLWRDAVASRPAELT